MPPTEGVEDGVVLVDNECAAAYIFNTANASASSLTGGHAALALEALVDGEYVAIKAEIFASCATSWFFWSSDLISKIRYQELKADGSDPTECKKICDIIFSQSGKDSSSSSSKNSSSSSCSSQGERAEEPQNALPSPQKKNPKPAKSQADQSSSTSCKGNPAQSSSSCSNQGERAEEPQNALPSPQKKNPKHAKSQADQSSSTSCKGNPAQSSSSCSNQGERAEEPVVRVKTSHYYEIPLEIFNRIKAELFKRQIIFSKAYISALLKAEKYEKTQSLISKLKQTSKKRKDDKPKGPTLVDSPFARLMRNMCPTFTVHLHYCEAFKSKYFEEGRTEEDLSTDKIIRTKVVKFIDDMPAMEAMPVLHTLDFNKQLDAEYPRFRLTGIGRGNDSKHNCLTWSKEVLTTCGIDPDISTFKPKKL